MPSRRNLPLSGVRVIDLTRVIAGPLSTMVLGDLGADVIKVEEPERGDDSRSLGASMAPGETSYYHGFNRNKRSVRADLGQPSGHMMVRDLCRHADVLVENFKAGGMEKYGLGYETLRGINPGLIYCAISGYDRQGSEAGRPGYDLVIQGEAGLMSTNGEDGGAPLKFGLAAVDIFTGMSASQAILAALYERSRTGTGRRIDLALYDCGVMLGSYAGLEALLRGRDIPRHGNVHPGVVPYGVFDAEDGQLVITVATDRQFRALCRDVLRRAELAEDPDFATNAQRSQNRSVLLPLLQAELASRTRDCLIEALTAAGIPCGKVLSMHEAISGPRTREAGLISMQPHPAIGSVPVMAPPWRFDGERLPASRPPRLGEHDDAIVEALREQGHLAAGAGR